MGLVPQFRAMASCHRRQSVSDHDLHAKATPNSQTITDVDSTLTATVDQPNGMQEEVQLALQKIRSDYRQAFILFHEHELSYGEIAETLNCPVGTIKTWIHRARREVVQLLVNRGMLEDRNAVR